jgi:hypothetical protein
MAEAAPEARERLFKTRRLLLLMSFILLAHYALGIQIKSDAESLGLRFEFAKVERVWVGVWVVWTWAVVTYLQYCHELGFDDFPKEHFQDAQFRILSWIDRRQMLKDAETKGIQGRKGKPKNLVFTRGPMVTIGSKLRQAYSVEVNWNGNDTGKFRWIQRKLNTPWGYVAQSWAWVFVMTTTRFGTDYYAPLLIALAAFGFGVYSAAPWAHWAH